MKMSVPVTVLPWMMVMVMMVGDWACAQPNILFILVDDQEGFSPRYMPHLNEHIIEKGTTFKNYIMSSPLCGPSRATMLTSVYAKSSGLQGNHPPNGGFHMFHDSGYENNTVAVWLQQHGQYLTMKTGKYINGYGQLDPPNENQPTLFVPVLFLILQSCSAFSYANVWEGSAWLD